MNDWSSSSSVKNDENEYHRAGIKHLKLMQLYTFL